MIIKQIRSLGDYDDGYYISWWSDIYLMHYHVIIFNILQHLCLSLLLIDNIYIYAWYNYQTHEIIRVCIFEHTICGLWEVRGDLGMRRICSHENQEITS